MHRIQLRWWNGPSEIRSQECGFCLLSLSLWFFPLARSDEASCPWELPCEEAHTARNKGGATESCNKQVTGLLSPQVSLEMTATWLDFIATWERPWARGPGWSMPGFLTHRNHEIINICCLKPLCFQGNLLGSNRSLLARLRGKELQIHVIIFGKHLYARQQAHSNGQNRQRAALVDLMVC